MALATLIGVAAVVWPVGLGLALADRVDGHTTTASAVVYLAASRVCHQRPDRSFHTHGAQWPVCARCAGLYLAAPIGLGLWAMAGPRRRPALARVVAGAAIPTIATWALETVGGMPVSGELRLLAAAPLGAAVVFAVMGLVRPAGRTNRID